MRYIYPDSCQLATFVFPSPSTALVLLEPWPERTVSTDSVYLFRPLSASSSLFLSSSAIGRVAPLWLSNDEIHDTRRKLDRYAMLTLARSFLSFSHSTARSPAFNVLARYPFDPHPFPSSCSCRFIWTDRRNTGKKSKSTSAPDKSTKPKPTSAPDKPKKSNPTSARDKSKKSTVKPKTKAEAPAAKSTSKQTKVKAAASVSVPPEKQRGTTSDAGTQSSSHKGVTFQEPTRASQRIAAGTPLKKPPVVKTRTYSIFLFFYT